MEVIEVRGGYLVALLDIYAGTHERYVWTTLLFKDGQYFDIYAETLFLRKRLSGFHTRRNISSGL